MSSSRGSSSSRRRVYSNRIKKWEGQDVKDSVEYLDKIKHGSINYFQIRFEGREHWVIRQQFTDKMIVIARLLENYFNIPSLEYLISGKYILIRSYNPEETPELTLTEYVRECKSEGKKIPLYVHRQIQNIYAFRYMLGVSQNTNSSLCLRQKGRKLLVYNLKLTFNREKCEFSQSIITTWFAPGLSKRQRTLEECIYDLLGAFNDDDFEKKRDELDEYLADIIPSIDIDLVWFQSDIINMLIKLN